MNWLDIMYLAIVMMATTFGLLTGLILQGAMIGILAISIGVASYLAEPLSKAISRSAESADTWRVLAFALVFLLCAGALVGVAMLIKRAWKNPPLKKTNRVLGAAFGLCAGLLICALIVVAAVPEGKSAARGVAGKSLFTPHLARAVAATRGWVSGPTAERLRNFSQKARNALPDALKKD